MLCNFFLGPAQSFHPRRYTYSILLSSSIHGKLLQICYLLFNFFDRINIGTVVLAAFLLAVSQAVQKLIHCLDPFLYADFLYCTHQSSFPPGNAAISLPQLVLSIANQCTAALLHWLALCS